jgi:MoxR-like ATPase
MPFESIDDLEVSLRDQLYLADRGLATSIFLSLKLERPLFLEGEAGVGKTEVAKALASSLDTELIRLQCYEGLDVHHAVYEWNYTRQMLHIRMLEARGERPDEQAPRSTRAADTASNRLRAEGTRRGSV